MKRVVPALILVLIFSTPSAVHATSVMPIVCAPYTSASWGTARVCWRGDRWQVDGLRDTKTDGFCITAVSTNGNSILRSCTNTATSSVWMTTPKGGRIVRDDGRYVTLVIKAT